LSFPDSLSDALSPQRRVVIQTVTPSVDDGAFRVKRCVGDVVKVEAVVFADGHEKLAADIVYRHGEGSCSRIPMHAGDNDRWHAEITLTDIGLCNFHIEAWIDAYGGFVRDTRRKQEAGQPLALEAREGIALLLQVANGRQNATRGAVKAICTGLPKLPLDEQIAILLAPETLEAMRASDAKQFLTTSYHQPIDVERTKAGFASWYELFPRSAGAMGSHGTLQDVVRQLPRIRAMGFDVLYLTPIHPIGRTNRKGRNNALTSGDTDPGSPYAIGSSEGGHDAIHPELGTLDDFRALVGAARSQGMELALDIAVQMSPDHPWIAQHPTWFKRRPDGTMKYAENPPKKYEDIVIPEFYADPALWTALRDIFLFWASEGVRIFRVDNPHTKPIPLWAWLIAEVRAAHPDVIFLAEAFTRPALMYHLAKIGFTESYTYFTWRNTKAELTAYLTELSQTEVREYFRPHFFVNTPDINPFFLQSAGRAGFLIRAALAATTSGLWGMYSGFEICENAALRGREEYLDSEKYELKSRDYDATGNIAREITQLNALRKDEPVFRSHFSIRFLNAFNDNIFYFSKTGADGAYCVLVAINLDPHQTQACSFEVPLWEWGLPDHETLLVEDLVNGDSFSWSGKVQHMALSQDRPYAIWRVRPAKGARS
jgi:starch synthase (maltosyl-transferring)